MVKLLDDQAMTQIVEAIRQAELKTSGEIRVHIQQKCGGNSLNDAWKTFRKLGMHRTKDKNAVLLFIAQSSHRFAIIGDEGIHCHVGDLFWDKTRDNLAQAFLQDQFKEGIISAVHEIGDQLKIFFPAAADDKNELSNTVTTD